MMYFTRKATEKMLRNNDETLEALKVDPCAASFHHSPIVSLNVGGGFFLVTGAEILGDDMILHGFSSIGSEPEYDSKPMESIASIAGEKGEAIKIDYDMPQFSIESYVDAWETGGEYTKDADLLATAGNNNRADTLDAN